PRTSAAERCTPPGTRQSRSRPTRETPACLSRRSRGTLSDRISCRPRRRRLRRLATREEMVERPRVPSFRRIPLVVVAGDHRRNRVRVNREYHEDMDHAQDHYHEHRHEVPVARPHISAEKIREPRQLNGLPNGNSSRHGERASDGEQEIRRLLKRVVLALMRMILPLERVK